MFIKEFDNIAILTFVIKYLILKCAGKIARAFLFSGNQYISYLDIRHYHHSVADCFLRNIFNI